MKDRRFRRAKCVFAVLVVVFGSFTCAWGQTVFDTAASIRQNYRLQLAAVNGKYYMAKYEDLCKAFDANDSAAIQHFASFGKKEGRQPSPFFAARYYLAKYPDLQNAFGSDYVAAFNHWQSFGIKEGRAASQEFDPQWYLQNYPDLAKAFGPTNYRAAIIHFAEYGIREKRRGAKDYDYARTFEPTNRCHGVPFSMIMLSDPQYARVEVTTSPDASPIPTPAAGWTKEKIAQQSVEDNNAVIKTINLIAGNTATNLKGVIINGDLTEFGHADELAKFIELYGGTKVRVPLYLGLGNHDYANNVDDCYQNNCASRMVEYMANHVSRLPTPVYAFDYSKATKTGSLAYSWDMGNVHFVQLQNHPGYTESWSGYTIQSSMDWLARDLSDARLRGKYIIINLHDATDATSRTGFLKNTVVYDQFVEMVKEYNVSAIFAGHDHAKSGLVSAPRLTAPLLLSGAANYRTFLSAKFGDYGSLQVSMINTHKYPQSKSINLKLK